MGLDRKLSESEMVSNVTVVSMNEVPPKQGIKKEQLLSEQEQRKLMYEQLDALEGFQRLSPTQQRMIKGSLYIRQRTDREPRKGTFFEDLTDSSYALSKTHRNQFFCHGAVFYLENELPVAIKPAQVDPYQHEDQYQKIEQAQIYENLHAAIATVGVPCVLRLNYKAEKPDAPRQYEALHTLIALGTDASGEMMIWEKTGYREPYRYTTLRKVQENSFSGFRNWTVRPLMAPDPAVKERILEAERKA